MYNFIKLHVIKINIFYKVYDIKEIYNPFHNIIFNVTPQASTVHLPTSAIFLKFLLLNFNIQN